MSEQRLDLWSPDLEPLRSDARAAAIEAYGALAPDPDAPAITPEKMVQFARAGGADLFPERSDDAEDRELAGVPCRVHLPAAQARALYLHFHGGGMAIGSPDLNDAENVVLARELGLAVVSVDYRLAPEWPYPAALTDAYSVAAWLVAEAEAEFGTGDLLIGGESAGAYLAAMVLLHVRDELDAINLVKAANLVFGVFDWGRSPSQRGFQAAAGPDWLAADSMAVFADLYLPGLTDDERRDPAISPAFADLSGLPPALFTIGTLDHMFDDSLMMAARWRIAGNQSELAVYPDCGHGFHWFTDTEMSRRAVSRIHGFLRGSVGLT